MQVHDPKQHSFDPSDPNYAPLNSINESLLAVNTGSLAIAPLFLRFQSPAIHANFVLRQDIYHKKLSVAEMNSVLNFKIEALSRILHLLDMPQVLEYGALIAHVLLVFAQEKFVKNQVMHCSDSSALYLDAIFIQVFYNFLVKIVGYFDERRDKCYVWNLVRSLPGHQQFYCLFWFFLEKLMTV